MGVYDLGYSLTIAFLEGDRTGMINTILEPFNYRDIKDLFETDNFHSAHLEVRKTYLSKKGLGRDILLIGVCKGWTVIEQIYPGGWEYSACSEVSALIQAKSITVNMETHAESYQLIYCDKGRTLRKIEKNDLEIVENYGEQFPLNTEDGVPSVSEKDIEDIVEQINGIEMWKLDMSNGGVEKVVVKSGAR